MRDKDDNRLLLLVVFVAAINPATLAHLLLLVVEVAAALILVNGNRMFCWLSLAVLGCVFFCGVDRDTVSSVRERERERDGGC